MLFLRMFKYLLICFFISFIIVPHAYANDYVEHFDNSLTLPGLLFTLREPLRYESDSSSVYAILKKGSLSNSFNYYRSVDLGSIDDNLKSISMNIKFSSNQITQGAGYIFSDNVPNQGQPLYFDSYMFFIWPKGDGNFHLFANLCPSSDPSCSIDHQITYGVFAMPTDGLWHKLKISRIFSHYELFIDDALIFRTANTNRQISGIGIGDPEDIMNILLWPTLYIDYIKLEYSPNSFPYLSQLDQRWADHEYDSAQKWAGIDKSNIGRWGCALTSAVMELQYFGVKMPDGREITPDNLNTWLKSQRDGYVGAGFVNWLAITRLTHQSYLANNSPSELEFVKEPGTSIPLLPAILGLNGHFVVAHRDDILNWKINDPALESRDTLPKTTKLASINRFIPSQTDLSYLLFVSDPQEKLEIANGQEYLEELVDDTNSSNKITKKFVYVQKPTDGAYLLKVSNPTGSIQTIDAYMYDQNGTSVSEQLYLPPKSTAEFVINYSPIPNSTPQIALNYSSILNDIRSMRTIKTPANGIYQSLFARFSELIANKNNFNELSRFVVQQSPKNIDPAYTFKLQNYIMLIKEN